MVHVAATPAAHASLTLALASAWLSTSDIAGRLPLASSALFFALALASASASALALALALPPSSSSMLSTSGWTASAVRSSSGGLLASSSRCAPFLAGGG